VNHRLTIDAFRTAIPQQVREHARARTQFTRNRIEPAGVTATRRDLQSIRFESGATRALRLGVATRGGAEKIIHIDTQPGLAGDSGNDVVISGGDLLLRVPADDLQPGTPSQIGLWETS
jgi:hypothetical protein